MPSQVELVFGDGFQRPSGKLCDMRDEMLQAFASINAAKPKILGCNELHPDCRTVNRRTTVMSSSVDSQRKKKMENMKWLKFKTYNCNHQLETAHLSQYHDDERLVTNILTNYCIHDRRVKRTKVQSCKTALLGLQTRSSPSC